MICPASRHGFGFGFAFLENDSDSASALRAVADACHSASAISAAFRPRRASRSLTAHPAPLIPSNQVFSRRLISASCHLALLLLLNSAAPYLFGNNLMLDDVALESYALRPVRLGFVTSRESALFSIPQIACDSACLARDKVSASQTV